MRLEFKCNKCACSMAFLEVLKLHVEKARLPEITGSACFAETRNLI